MAHIGNAPFGKTVRTVTSETLTSVKTAYYPTGGYIVGYVDVYVNGVRLTETADFTATDGTTVTLLYSPSIGDTVDVVTYGSIELANAVRRDGDTLVGTLYTRALVPTANVTYDIGTSTMRYRDIFLSGNTINLGDIKLSTNGTAFSVANTSGGTFPSALANTTITGTLFTNGAVTIANSTGNSVFFNTDGTVSLGTANNVSSRRFQVVGQSAAITANGYIVVELDSDPSANLGYIGTKSNTAVAIKTNDSGKLYVMANGNVGIGNNTPATKMHVAGSITLDTDSAIRTGGGTWMIGSSNTEITIGSQAANSARAIGLYPNSSSIPAIYCSSNGNVGYGTSSPTSLIHVSSNGGFIAVDNYKEATNSANGAQIRLNSSGTYWAWIYSTSSQKQALGWGSNLNPQGTALTWDFGNGGIVNMPQNPAFMVRQSTSTSGFGADAIASWDTVILNRGGYFKTTAGTGQNQRFIAPVAGVYHFNCQILSNSGSRLFHHFRVNGADVYGTWVETLQVTGLYTTGTSTMTYSLAQGDYVEVFVAAYAAYGGYYANFNGFLVG